MTAAEIDGIVGFILSGGRMSIENILESHQVSKTFPRGCINVEISTFISLRYSSSVKDEIIA